VKVTAVMWAASALPEAMRAAMRRTMLVVFPVPAAASTRKLVSRCSSILVRSAASGSVIPAPLEVSTEPPHGIEAGVVPLLELDGDAPGLGAGVAAD